MKTSELTGAALDWAVAKCMGEDPRMATPYSSEWAFGGPLIEREEINININAFHHTYWEAWTPAPEQERGEAVALGPTPLVAAMRCFVASRLGEEVDVPEGLTNEHA